MKAVMLIALLLGLGTIMALAGLLIRALIEPELLNEYELSKVHFNRCGRLH